jgi:hypothetical protein
MSIAQIPYWMYGVLVVLGWNEAMVVLFNPLYFTFTLMSLVTAYVFDSDSRVDEDLPSIPFLAISLSS